MGRIGSLSDEEVQEMRRRFMCEMHTIKAISADYGRPISTIRNVLYYENYAHVPDTFDPREVRRSV